MTSFGVRMQRPIRGGAGTGSGLEKNRTPFYEPESSSAKGATLSYIIHDACERRETGSPARTRRGSGRVTAPLPCGCRYQSHYRQPANKRYVYRVGSRWW